MGIKEYTHDRIFDYYKEYGLGTAIDVARSLLDKRINISKDNRTGVNGEIGEVVLELILLNYCIEHKKETRDWCWGKSLILKDPTHKTDFLTELDFTLFTPACVYIFECKSYAGDKVLRGRGVIERKNKKDFDVFKQNLIHLETLDKWIGKFSTDPIYQMVLFDFSKGGMQDIRQERYRRYLPCCNENNVLQLLQQNHTPVWDMKYLKKCLDVLEKDSLSLHEQHLSYVKRLHGGD